jgi:hypothetical protein
MNSNFEGGAENHLCFSSEHTRKLMAAPSGADRVFREVASSGLGAAITDTIFNPLDIIKVHKALLHCLHARPLKTCQQVSRIGPAGAPDKAFWGLRFRV